MNTDADKAPSPGARRPSNLWLIIVAGLFIVVPFLTWYLTWFGRNLSDEQIATYLADEKNPRHIQHALSQLEARMENRDPAVKKFYPQLLALAKSPTGEIRKTAAWVMGQDNTYEDFHRALLELLKDSEPLVRRNAALQLVRFGDASGRPELRAMLQPFEAKSPWQGTVVSLLPAGSKLNSGGLIARIRDSSGTVQEFRSPVDGAISAVALKEGEPVNSDQMLASIAPDRATLKDALQALAYVGTAEDLPLLESSVKSAKDPELSRLASTATSAINSRSNPKAK
jgi:HEAT repeat protein